MRTRLPAVLLALGLVAGGAAVHDSGHEPAAATPADTPNVAPAATPAVIPEPGADGIGDPYFPLDGNGGIDVRSYEIHDTYLFAGRLSGWTRLTLRTTADLSSFDLDLLLPVSSVRLSTGPASYTRPSPHELRIQPRDPLAAGTILRVLVRYAGRPGHYSYAGESNWLATRREAEAVNEPHMAPWWFPSNDHPLDKARMDIHVTVPRGRQVISNGRLIGVRRTAHRATYHWGGAGPMATYLAFFVAGRFQVAQGTSHHLPYYLAVSRALPSAERRAAMRGLSRTPAIVAWLQRQLGRYPFSRTGGVVTALDPQFSLENQTRPVYPRDVSTLLMVHELAHQWFGDSVSVHHWSDVWLNEGFATYMEQAWTEAHGGWSTRTWLEQAYQEQPAAFWDLVVGDPGAAHIFDWSVYERGAMTLAALRNRIGDRDFSRLLHRWTTDHRYGHGTTAAFESLAGEVSGLDLTSFFDAWLHEPTQPAHTSANGL